MKIRIKFAKRGYMKFVGHLDIMRYFQKAIRRSELDVIYSGGYTPHQKMSFASPLGVGLESEAEYFDIELNSAETSKFMLEKLNNNMVEGIEILSIKVLPDDSKTAMAIISGADYEVTPKDNNILFDVTYLSEKIIEFYNQKEILIIKKTKKSEKEIDIKPLIYKLNYCNKKIFMQLAAGSVDNLKPELLMQALYIYLGLEFSAFDIQICRLEIYYLQEDQKTLIPLECMGKELI